MPTLQTYKGVYLWKYVPNFPLAVVFCGLFAIGTAVHSWRLYRTRAIFTIPLILGGLCESPSREFICSLIIWKKLLTLFVVFDLFLGEVIGYATRAAASSNTGSLILYLIQCILLVIPPLGFAATLYMVYSRIVRGIHGEDLSPVPMRWATKIFVGGDFTCFMVQGNAAGLLGNNNAAIVRIADYIIIVGLILQIELFLFFIVCCIVFHRRMNVYVKETRLSIPSPWHSGLNMLYGTSTAVLVRNIYRVVEYVMQSISQHVYLLTNEWPLYVFDGQLMLFLMIGFYVCYPAELRHCTTESGIELQSSDSPASAESSHTASPSALNRNSRHIKE